MFICQVSVHPAINEVLIIIIMGKKWRKFSDWLNVRVHSDILCEVGFVLIWSAFVY